METLDDIYFHDIYYADNIDYVDDEYGYYGHYGYMSNFFTCKFIFDNHTFNSSKQFFVYMKAKTFENDNIELHKKILEEENILNINKFSRQIQNYSNLIWHNIRYEIMIQGLKLKFGQNLELKLKLLSTGDKKLYYASESNKIWSIGCNISDAYLINKSDYGYNLLGKALVEVRHWLKLN